MEQVQDDQIEQASSSLQVNFSQQNEIEDEEVFSEDNNKEQIIIKEDKYKLFELQCEFEVCLKDNKEYINDVSAIFLKEEEINLYKQHFNKCYGHILILISSRNNISEMYWQSDNKINPQLNKDKQENNKDIQQGGELISRYEHKSKQLVCQLKRVQQQIRAIVGQTDGKIVFINPLTSMCELELSLGENIVDFVLENNYLIYIEKSKLITVFDLDVQKIVAQSEQLAISGSHNCIELIEKTPFGLKVACGNKINAVQIFSIQYLNNKKLKENQQLHMNENDQIQNTESSVSIKFIYKLCTLQVWNLTVDVLRQFKNQTNDQTNGNLNLIYYFEIQFMFKELISWRDIDHDNRYFDSNILACGGSFFDAQMIYAVQVFNWKTKQHLRTIENGHKGWVNSLKFFNDQSGDFIVGSADKNTTIYSSITSEILKRFKETDLVVMHGLRMLNLSNQQKQILQLPNNYICLLGAKEKDKLYVRLLY